MIIVTGGAGMIGSNLINKLNKLGRKDIIVVDDLTDGHKCKNLSDLDFIDFIDKNVLKNLIFLDKFPKNIDAVLHQGACSDTTEWNGNFIMENNYEFSKSLLNICLEKSIQFINASSASVYGLGCNGFKEERYCELPINMYAFSKFQFDQYIRSINKCNSQVVSLRYFNVYGPRESHKKSMASMPYHFNNQILKEGKCKLFEGYSGYDNGEQKRDFIYVDDCVSVIIWFMQNPLKSGIFNVGTGKSKTINQMAQCVLDWHEDKNKKFYIEYIPFPEQLKGAYQNFTQADIMSLRGVGYDKEFIDLKEGVFKYLDYLNKTS